MTNSQNYLATYVVCSNGLIRNGVVAVDNDGIRAVCLGSVDQMDCEPEHTVYVQGVIAPLADVTSSAESLAEVARLIDQNLAGRWNNESFVANNLRLYSLDSGCNVCVKPVFS